MSVRLGCAFFCLAAIICLVTAEDTFEETRVPMTKNINIESSKVDEVQEVEERKPQALQKRFLSSIGLGGVSDSLGAFWTNLGGSSWSYTDSGSFVGGHEQSYDQEGVKFRFTSPEEFIIVNIKNGKVYVNEVLVCDDISKLPAKLSYRKTDDGAYWHTNLNLGKPMKKAEIRAFERAFGN